MLKAIIQVYLLFKPTKNHLKVNKVMAKNEVFFPKLQTECALVSFKN